ncbi:MAG: GIY-YIG nuclease family protein [Desulfobulbus sp.]
MEPKDLKSKLQIIAEDLVKFIWPFLKKVDIQTVEKSDGRSKDSHETCKNGSFIYLLYDINDNLLYVGETGKSIKTRLTGDGSGSHYKKDWYKDVAYIKYYGGNSADLSDKERKIIEESISLVKRPKHYR